MIATSKVEDDMKILVDRDSVCIGDDVLPHEMEFDVDDTMTVQDFFCIFGNEEVFVFHTRKRCCVGTL